MLLWTFAVENGCNLDMSFNEDHNKTRKGYAAENLTIIRHIALNLLKTNKSVKAGIATKRKKAGWDHEYLANLLGYAVI